MAEIEPLEGLSRLRAGQNGFACAPLHQPHLFQMSYEPGNCLSLYAKLLSEDAGIYRPFRSRDEDKRPDIVLA